MSGEWIGLRNWALLHPTWLCRTSGLVLEKENRQRIGVAMGTAYAGWEFAAREYEVYQKSGVEALSSYMGIAIFTGACGGQISLHLGLQGQSTTTATGLRLFERNHLAGGGLDYSWRCGCDVCWRSRRADPSGHCGRRWAPAGR